MGGGKRDMFGVKKVLKNFEVIYFPYDTGLYDSFEILSRQLECFINGLDLVEGEKVSLVGVSAGGIIADYYLKFIDSKRVDKFVAICSPFGGTYLSYLFSRKRKGIKQLLYFSSFIKKLRSKKLRNVDVVSFWSYFDLLVPGVSGRYEKSYHSLFFLHWVVHFWPPILWKIRKILEI